MKHQKNYKTTLKQSGLDGGKELVEDIIALIHSFSGKLYDLRHKIKKEIKCNEKS